MNVVVRAEGLGMRYRLRWALRECSFELPAGRVVGLVGPNGSGKTTLLNLAVGLLTPTAGRIEVLGADPAAKIATPAQLGRVGYVAQDTPVYAGLSVADHLQLGARLNPGWDAALAQERIRRLGLDPRQKAGRLSGGERAQLALTLGVAKRPDLLLLDEPVASLDPLARREFLQDLMATVADQGLSVVLSSHLVSDVERVCDYLVILLERSVRVCADLDTLLGSHYRITGPRRDRASLPRNQHVVTAAHTDRQSTFVIRTDAAILDPAWTVSRLSLEDLVLAYLTPTATAGSRPSLQVQR
jgi:ABC-2 type transport system ATP-binding protein